MTRIASPIDPKIILLFCGSLFVSIFLFLFLQSGHAFAWSDYTYPDCCDNSAHIGAARKGNGVFLDAPTAFLKVKYSASDTDRYIIDFEDLCYKQGVDYGSSVPTGCVAGQVSILICPADGNGNYINPPPLPICWGADAAGLGNNAHLEFQRPGSNLGLYELPTQADPSGYVSLFVQVTMNVSGSNAFKVTSRARKSDYSNANYSRVGFGASGDLGLPQSLMHSPLSATGNSEYKVNFRATCETPTNTFKLAWFDADRPPSGVPSDPDIWWELRNGTTGVSASNGWYDGGNSNGYLGGQDDYREQTINSGAIRIQSGDSYSWSWHSVGNDNGVQMYLPFDEPDSDIGCQPTDVIVAGVSGCSTDVITGVAQDRDSPNTEIRVLITVDALPEFGGQSVYDQYTSGHNFSYSLAGNKDAYGRNYYVRAYDITNRAIPSGNFTHATGSPYNPGVCRPPDCGALSLSPSAPEPNVQFSANANFAYQPGAQGRAMQYTMVLNAPPSPAASTSGYYSTSGTAPPGATRTNSISSIFSQATANTYSVNYVVAWLPNLGQPIPQWMADQIRGYGGQYTIGYAGNDAYAVLTCGETYQVGRKPYFKIYGNDAQVGSAFNNGNTTCTAPTDNPTFRGFNKAGSPPADPKYGFMKGAGVQFALFSLGKPQEVPSSGMSILRDVGKPTNLTFANSDRNGQIYQQYGDGGGVSRCIPDFYSRHPDVAPRSAASITPGATYNTDLQANDGTQISYVRNGNVNDPADCSGIVAINGSDLTLASKKKHTIYVCGDAKIANASNITYGNGSFTIANTPNFTLVVDGNLYIDNETSQLDGTYIAQNKSDSNKGVIRTCYSSSDNSPISSINLAQVGANGCGNKLTVNGAFIAKQIKLLRTNGSLSSSLPAVAPQLDFSWSYTNVGNPGDCVQVNEPGITDPTRRQNWNDNWLCMPPGIKTFYGVEWVNNGAYGLGASPTPASQGMQRNKNSNNGKECVQFYEPAMPNDGTSWSDNWLCMNSSPDHELKFFPGGDDPQNIWPENPLSNEYVNRANWKCVSIYEPSDSWPAAYIDPQTGLWVPPSVYNGTWHDNYLCERKIAVNSDPEQSSDSNIAEVFNFTPEIYIQPTTWNISGNQNSNDYNSITSLPPIF